MIQTALNFAQGIVDGLSVLGADLPGEIELAVIEDPSELEHDVLATSQGRIAPRRKGQGGSSNRLIDIFVASENDFGRLLPGGRVEHGRRVAADPFPMRSRNPVIDLVHGDSSWQASASLAPHDQDSRLPLGRHPPN